MHFHKLFAIAALAFTGIAAAAPVPDFAADAAQIAAHEQRDSGESGTVGPMFSSQEDQGNVILHHAKRNFKINVNSREDINRLRAQNLRDSERRTETAQRKREAEERAAAQRKAAEERRKAGLPDLPKSGIKTSYDQELEKMRNRRLQGQEGTQQRVTTPQGGGTQQAAPPQGGATQQVEQPQGSANLNPVKQSYDRTLQDLRAAREQRQGQDYTQQEGRNQRADSPAPPYSRVDPSPRQQFLPQAPSFQNYWQSQPYWRQSQPQAVY